jgi:hypothetical protein
VFTAGDFAGIIENGGTANAGNVSMSVFPNPSSLGFVNLSLSNADGFAQEGFIEVRDVTGRILSSQRVAVESNQLFQVDTNDLPEGIYTVSYQSGDERVTQRLMVR